MGADHVLRHLPGPGPLCGVAFLLWDTSKSHLVSCKLSQGLRDDQVHKGAWWHKMVGHQEILSISSLGAGTQARLRPKWYHHRYGKSGLAASENPLVAVCVFLSPSHTPA